MCLKFSLDKYPRCAAAFFEARFYHEWVKLQLTGFFKTHFGFFLCCLKQAHTAEEFKFFFKLGRSSQVSFN